jgi:hypothetical protein
MPLKFSFKVDPEGMTVPYPPVTDEIRRNRGFVDLRKKPESANEVAEGAESVALQALLVRVAKNDSSIFTIGCDLGAHREARTFLLSVVKSRAAIYSLPVFNTK